MARTTLEIEDPILRDLKHIQKREGKPLGRVVSEVLAEGLAQRRRRDHLSSPRFHWNQQAMRARVELGDKDAVWQILDEPDRDGP